MGPPVRSLARPFGFPPMIDLLSIATRFIILSPLTSARKQQVAWKEYCEDYIYVKQTPGKHDRCIGHCIVTEKILKNALNANDQLLAFSINVFKGLQGQ